MNKKVVAVLFGGASSEHDVSLLSATSVLQNLDQNQYDILPIGITRQGAWFLYEGDIAHLKDGTWHTHDCTPVAVCPGSGLQGLVCFENGAYRNLPVDVVFPVLHGKNGEDGTLQGLLELAKLPYVGCGVLGSALCMDKITANFVMDAAGIARCPWDYMETREMAAFDTIEARVAQKLHYPIFVKPANAGSSVGISKATNKQELLAAVQLAAQHDTRIVFERFVKGQEIECAVCGNDAVFSTYPGEIIASKEFYDYEDKYLAGTSTVRIPADLAPAMLEQVRTAAAHAYRTLCCTGLSRVDFFLEEGTGALYLNEINTLPGFTDISMYPKMMIAAGNTYSELLDKLLALALERAEVLYA